MDPSTAMIQALLVASGQRVTVDGIMGRKTKAALARSPIVNSKVGVISNLVREVKPSNPNEDWVPVGVVEKYARQAHLVTGIPARTIMFMISLEATKSGGSNGKSYNAKSISATKQHKGLGQLNAAAWNEAESFRSRHKLGSPLGSFDENWSNPEKSVMAMAYYSKLTEQYARPLLRNLKFTDPVRYTIYNQGAGFISKVLSGDPTILGTQSDEAGKLRKIATYQILAA
jgi:hypothetical protein